MFARRGEDFPDATARWQRHRDIGALVVSPGLIGDVGAQSFGARIVRLQLGADIADPQSHILGALGRVGSIIVAVAEEKSVIGGVELDRRLIEPQAGGGLVLGGHRLVAPQTPQFGDRHDARLEQRVRALHRGVGFQRASRSRGKIVAQRSDARIELTNPPVGELPGLSGEVVEGPLGEVPPRHERGTFGL